MSVVAVHVRIGRLFVDQPPRGDAAGWADAIERALRARLPVAPEPDSSPTRAEHPTEAIARQTAQRIGAAVPTTKEPTWRAAR